MARSLAERRERRQWPERRYASRSGHCIASSPSSRRRRPVRARHRRRGLRAGAAGARRAVVVRADGLRRASGPAPATAGGFAFVIEHGLEALERRHGHRAGLAGGRRGRRWRRAAHARGARLVSICSGVFVLAAAGLLDGREAATHWRYAAALAERHPRPRQRRRALRRRRRRADVGGQRRRDRPVPARRPPRPRQRGRQRRRAAARDPAAPRRRPGAADRAAVPARPRRPDRARHGVGARAPARAARPGDAGRARVHERAHVHAPLPARDGTTPGAGCSSSACARVCPARGRGRADRDRCGARGFGSAATYRHHFAAIMRTSPTAYRRAFYAAAE